MIITRLLHKVIRYPVYLRENYKKKKLIRTNNQKLAKFVKVTREK